MENYKLSTGNVDEIRLDTLNSIYNPYSQRFIEKHLFNYHLPTSLLDIGCGHGHMTCYFAKQLVDVGRVTGQDNSESQILIAINRAKVQNLRNTAFEIGDISKPSSSVVKFSCTYSRFLLMHLSNKLEAISNTANLLDKDGISIFEEPCLSSQFCHPYFPEFYRANELTIQLGKASRLSYDSAVSLLEDISKFYYIDAIEISQPILDTSIKKQIILDSFLQIAPALINSRLTDDFEVKEITSKLSEFVLADSSFSGGLRVFHIKARLKNYRGLVGS